MVADTCKSQQFGRPRRVDHLRSGVWDQPVQHGGTSSLLKIQKLAWCNYMPVIPVTQEAEAEESLELRRQKLQWAKIASLHSSLGGRVIHHLQKRKYLLYGCFLYLLSLNPTIFHLGNNVNMRLECHFIASLFFPMPPDLNLTSLSHFYLMPPLSILMTATHAEYYSIMCQALC